MFKSIIPKKYFVIGILLMLAQHITASHYDYIDSDTIPSYYAIDNSWQLQKAKECLLTQAQQAVCQLYKKHPEYIGNITLTFKTGLRKYRIEHDKKTNNCYFYATITNNDPHGFKILIMRSIKLIGPTYSISKISEFEKSF